MKLSRKQKILLTLIIILGVFLLWQLYDMFGGSSNNDTTTAVTTTAPKTLQPTTTTTATTTTVAKIPPAAPTTQQPITGLPPTATTPAPMQQMTIQAPMTPDQIEYLRLVDRYQIEKMRHLLFDEVAATTASRLKAAQLRQQIQQISGQATTTPVYGTTTGANINLGYQLMYIDFQNGQWTATLNYNGRFQEVTAGQTLIDGTRIIKINQNGVVVNKNGRGYLISFYGTTVLNDNAAQFFSTPPTTPSSAPVVPIKKYYRPVTSCVRQTPGKTCSGKPMTVTHVSALPQKPVIVNTLPRATLPPASKVTKTQINKPILGTNAMPATVNNPVVTKSKINNSTVTTTVTVKPAPTASTATTMTMLAPTATNAAPSATTTSTVPPVPGSAVNTGKATLQLTSQQKNMINQIEATLPPAADSYSADEKTLLNVSPKYFTLQLMGSYHLSDLTNFIKANQLQGKAYAFHTYYLNKDWYVLVYGIYKTQQDALNAIANLPAIVKNLKPWVRDISSVQAAIKGPNKS